MKQNNYFPWWLGIITGAIFIFIGWHLLTTPGITTLRLMQLLGLYWLVAGVIDIILLVFDHHKGNVALRLAGSILGIIAGIVILNNAVLSTVFTLTFISYFIGFAFIFNGVVHMVMGNAVENRKYKWSWGSLLVGLVYLVFGLLVVTGPTIVTAAAFVWLIGFFAIIGGVMAIASSFIFKKVPASSVK